MASRCALKVDLLECGCFQTCTLSPQGSWSKGIQPHFKTLSLLRADSETRQTDPSFGTIVIKSNVL